MAKGPRWKGPSGSCWPPFTAVHNSTTRCWCWCRGNTCRIWCNVTVRMPVHLFLNTELPGCMVASHAPVSTEWANALTLVELLFFLTSVEWNTRESFLKWMSSSLPRKLNFQIKLWMIYWLCLLWVFLWKTSTPIMLSTYGGKTNCANPTRNRVPYKQQKVMAASTSSETHESEQVSDAKSNSDAESDSLLQSWDSWMEIESDLDSESYWRFWLYFVTVITYHANHI